jgi:hypothetical protein
MTKKRWKHPLDVSTGRVLFTPVLRSTGERLELQVDYASFPRSNKLGLHGYTQDVNTGQWYAIYGKECDIPGCCDAWVEEISAPPSESGKPAAPTKPSDDPLRGLSQELTKVIAALLTVEGVEGIGQPLTILTPWDLPADFLGFVERLRGGAIERDEDMLLITLPSPRGRRRKRKPGSATARQALEHLRKALLVLLRYATDRGVSADDVAAVLDEAKRQLRSKKRKPNGEDADR